MKLNHQAPIIVTGDTGFIGQGVVARPGAEAEPVDMASDEAVADGVRNELQDRGRRLDPVALC